MNAFRNMLTGEIDKRYLRICAVYRLLKKKRIGFACGFELLKQRTPKAEHPIMKAMLELWHANSLKDMMP